MQPQTITNQLATQIQVLQPNNCIQQSAKGSDELSLTKIQNNSGLIPSTLGGAKIAKITHTECSNNEIKNEISLYGVGNITVQCVEVQMAKLAAAFPKMNADFFNLLAERIIENNFTDKRITDAVSWVLDNFRYKELNIADIISFDKKIKLYTPTEYSHAANRLNCNDWKNVVINGRRWWFLQTDVAQKI